MKLGDTVKEVTQRLGIEQCDSCKERQKWLNDFGDSLMERINGALQRKKENGEVKSSNSEG
jgi:hypothetical protein